MSDTFPKRISSVPKQAGDMGPNGDPLEQAAVKQGDSWLEQNRAALQSSNDYIEVKGLPLAGHRPY